MNSLMMTSSGSASACPAIEGTLWGWGQNDDSGVLGTNDELSKSTPTQLGTATDWTNNMSHIMQATIHVVKNDGTLWGWGDNVYGEVGNGNTSKTSSPIQIGSLTDWANVTGGMHKLAVKTDGTLWGWGANFYGQLGTGNTTNYSSPVQIGSDTNWASAKLPEAYYAVAMKTDGTLWAMGHNFKGNLGDGTTTDRSSPVQVGSSTSWLAYDCTSRTTNGRVFAIQSV
jgi:alpha-tubulin suppressor-like RCC1 family protein